MSCSKLVQLLSATAGALSLVAFIALFGATPAQAGPACWGCEDLRCKDGHWIGGYTCSVGEFECGWFERIFIGCRGGYCHTFDACDSRANDRDVLDPDVDEPADESQMTAGAPPRGTLIAPTHPAPWRPATAEAETPRP